MLLRVNIPFFDHKGTVDACAGGGSKLILVYIFHLDKARVIVGQIADKGRVWIGEMNLQRLFINSHQARDALCCPFDHRLSPINQLHPDQIGGVASDTAWAEGVGPVVNRVLGGDRRTVRPDGFWMNIDGVDQPIVTHRIISSQPGMNFMLTITQEEGHPHEGDKRPPKATFGGWIQTAKIARDIV